MPLCVPKYFINCGFLRLPTALAFVMFGIIWGGGGGHLVEGDQLERTLLAENGPGEPNLEGDTHLCDRSNKEILM